LPIASTNSVGSLPTENINRTVHLSITRVIPAKIAQKPGYSRRHPHPNPGPTYTKAGSPSRKNPAISLIQKEKYLSALLLPSEAAFYTREKPKKPVFF
jgi:hypothetical protein